MAFNPVLIKSNLQAHDDYNDDYDDDDDDDEYDNLLCIEQHKDEVSGFARSGGKAKTTPKASGFSDHKEPRAPGLPEVWSYAKVSLFDNASAVDLAKNKRRLKLSISVRATKDRKFHNFTASLQGPFRNLKRGLSAADYATAHYDNVRIIYQLLKSETSSEVYVSKFYKSESGKKGQATPFLSVILKSEPKPGHYKAIIFFFDNIIEFDLTPLNISQKQKQANMICQASLGSAGNTTLDLRDTFF